MTKLPAEARSRVSARPRDLGKFSSPEVEREYLAAYEDSLALWPVPYSEETVSTPFAETHVIASGLEDGTPIVLLHATGMSSTVWFPNVGDLSQSRRTFAVDVLNEPGRTRQTELVTDPADCAAWLSGVLDGLGLGRVILVGSSFGGWLAINLALREPERVEKVVLLAPAASLLPFNRPTYVLLRSLPYVPIKPGAKQTLSMFLPAFEVEPRFARQFGLGVRGFRYANPRKSIFPNPYSDEELQALSVPTLLLLGDRERIYNARKALDRAVRLVPGIQTALVPDAGHIVAMQQPTIVNQRIAEFLSGDAVTQ